MCYGFGSMDIHFKCTQCGKCCHDSKIPLTVAEAIKWVGRGHQVQLICEASPWPQGLADNDPRAAHFKRRSFAAMSGCMPVRVVVALVANNAGACPNLQADMRCGIYEERPLVCRIYPAEMNPFVALNPAKKACPPEAWSAQQPLYQRDGTVVLDEVRRDIRSWRDTDALDVDSKMRLCAELSVHEAALVHDAVLLYSPAPDTLAAALTSATASAGAPAASTQWRLVSDRPETTQELNEKGAVAVHLRDVVGASYQHLSFRREALFGPYHRREAEL